VERLQLLRHLRASTAGRPPARATPKGNLLDRWILSSLETLNQEVVEAMDATTCSGPCAPFVRFIDDLTNWYIRRSRRRFWKIAGRRRQGRRPTHALRGAAAAQPRSPRRSCPFISEAIYRNLRTAGHAGVGAPVRLPDQRRRAARPALEAQMAA
jgi:isoleucyl-tRNA synthetase